MAYYFKSDKGVITIAQTNVRVNTSEGNIVTGVDDKSTTLKQLVSLSPITFSNGVVWTISTDYSTRTYTISDGSSTYSWAFDLTSNDLEGGFVVYPNINDMEEAYCTQYKSANINNTSYYLYIMNGSKTGARALLHTLISAEQGTPQREGINPAKAFGFKVFKYYSHSIETAATVSESGSDFVFYPTWSETKIPDRHQNAVDGALYNLDNYEEPKLYPQIMNQRGYEGQYHYSIFPSEGVHLGTDILSMQLEIRNIAKRVGLNSGGRLFFPSGASISDSYSILECSSFESHMIPTQFKIYSRRRLSDSFSNSDFCTFFDAGIFGSMDYNDYFSGKPIRKCYLTMYWEYYGTSSVQLGNILDASIDYPSNYGQGTVWLGTGLASNSEPVNNSCSLYQVWESSTGDYVYSQSADYYNNNKDWTYSVLTCVSYSAMQSWCRHYIRWLFCPKFENFPTKSDIGSEEESGSGGGSGGSYDFSSDNNPVPTVPNLSAVGSGFCSLYAPSRQDIKSLSNYLWSDAFSLDSFKKIFSNPMEGLISLSIIPFIPEVGQRQEIKFGGITTGAQAYLITKQIQTMECGSIYISKNFNSFMDYNPYTKASIYLPYVGLKQLNINQVMGKTVSVQYMIDCLTGTCVAFILADGNVIDQYPGMVASQIPITASSYNDLYSSLIGLAMSAGSVVAGTAVGGIGGLMATAPGLINSGVNAMVKAQPDVISKGSTSGSYSGMMSIQYPYIEFSQPHTAKINDYNRLKGSTLRVSDTLNTFTGYTIVEDVDLSAISGATSAEMDEIERLLKEGVYL